MKSIKVAKNQAWELGTVLFASDNHVVYIKNGIEQACIAQHFEQASKLIKHQSGREIEDGYVYAEFEKGAASHGWEMSTRRGWIFSTGDASADTLYRRKLKTPAEERNLTVGKLYFVSGTMSEIRIITDEYTCDRYFITGGIYKNRRIKTLPHWHHAREVERESKEAVQILGPVPVPKSKNHEIVWEGILGPKTQGIADGIVLEDWYAAKDFGGFLFKHPNGAVIGPVHARLIWVNESTREKPDWGHSFRNKLPICLIPTHVVAL